MDPTKTYSKLWRKFFSKIESTNFGSIQKLELRLAEYRTTLGTLDKNAELKSFTKFFMKLFPSANSKFQIPNSKFQIPNSKFQIPNSKFQVPNSKFQIPNNGAQFLYFFSYLMGTQSHVVFVTNIF
jgi:hypothetical protein